MGIDFTQVVRWQPQLVAASACPQDHCASNCSGHSCQDKDPCPHDKSCAKDS